MFFNYHKGIIAMKTILAIAVGKSSRELIFDQPNADLSAVRPYIKGLKDWLGQATHTDPDDPLPRSVMGTDYRIVYRERTVDDLGSAFAGALALPTHLIFCMSTSVARAASAWTAANSPTLPIVAIVSDPFGEASFGPNVCGASASRDRLAISGFKKFKKRGNIKKVYALARAGYSPSDKASAWLGKKVEDFIYVADTDDIQDAINHIPNVADRGLLVLPADRFFAFADDIVQWTGSMPTFWSAPDYPMDPSFGGYGIAQNTCGRFLAERVASIWKNESAGQTGLNAIPNPKWVAIDPDYATLKSGPERGRRRKRKRRPNPPHARKSSAARRYWVVSSDQRRRRPVSAASSRSIWELRLWLSHKRSSHNEITHPRPEVFERARHGNTRGR